MKRKNTIMTLAFPAPALRLQKSFWESDYQYGLKRQESEERVATL